MIPRRQPRQQRERLLRILPGATSTDLDPGTIGTDFLSWWLAGLGRARPNQVEAVTARTWKLFDAMKPSQLVGWIDSLLHSSLSASGALAAHRSALPGALLEGLMERADGWRLTEALADRMRMVDWFAFPENLARQVALFRAARTMQGEGLAAEMRAHQRLEDLFRTLTGDVADEVLVATLKSASQLELSVRNLRVVLAAMTPAFARGKQRPVTVVKEAFEAWNKWLGELPALRKSWLSCLADDTERPELAEGADLAYGRLHLQSLASLLTQVAEAELKEEPSPSLPEVVHIEKALDETGAGLLDGLEAWRDREEILAGSLKLLALLRISRAKLAPLTEKILLAEPLPPESVLLAGLGLLAKLLSGLSIGAATSAGKLIPTRRDAADPGLDEETLAIREASERIRRLLFSRLQRPGLTPRVQEEMVRVLLGAALPAEEAQPLIELVVASRNAAMLAGFFRSVKEHRSQTAFPHLERLHSLQSTFDAQLGELYRQALVAAAHEQVPALLRPEILAGSREAEAVLSSMGAGGSLDVLVGERRVGTNLRHIDKESGIREAALEKGAEQFGVSVEQSGEAQAASIDASRFSILGHGRSSELLLLNAEFQLELLPQLDELKELLGQVRDQEGRLRTLLSQVASLREQVRRIEAEIDKAVAAMERMRGELARNQRSIADLQSEANQLQSRCQQLGSQLNSARSNLATAQSQARNASQEQASALNREVSKIKNSVSRLDQELSGARSQFDAIPRKVKALQDANTSINSNLTRLDREVEAARRQAASRRSDQQRFHQQSVRTASDLESLRRQVAQLRGVVREITQRGEAGARRAAEEVRGFSQQATSALSQLKAAQSKATRALSEAQNERKRVQMSSSEILATEQQNANIQSSIEAKKEGVAQELSQQAASALHAERKGIEERRKVQELAISIDLLMARLRLSLGLANETQRLFRRLERV